MAFEGMDVDAVNNAGAQLKGQADQINSLVSAINNTVTNLDSIWKGKDADEFVHQWWPQHQKELQTVEEAIRGLGQSAINNASAQSQASGS